MKFKNKKLLVLGGVPLLVELVQYAQAEGAYVIVADYYENTYCKSVADEAWLMSTTDTEGLTEKSISTGVDGIISGFDDFNIKYCRLLAENINRPFYATLDQIDQTMDKQKFKSLCIKNNVPATRQIDIDKLRLDEIPYPVIIKPVDGSANRGITICRNELDMKDALEYARSTSKKGGSLVEEYLVGPEVGINYYLQDGHIVLSAMHDRYMIKNEGKHPRLPLAYVYPSKYLDQYREVEDQAVRDMFTSIGMTDGTLFLQGIHVEGKVYFYEMGYRLNGAKQYQIIAQECGVNPMNAIVNHSLTGRMGLGDEHTQIDPDFNSYYCTLSIPIHPGRLDRYVGLDELLSYDDLNITVWLNPGDALEPATLGTQKQIALRITIKADNLSLLATRINEVYATLDILDAEGRSMIVDRFDTDQLFEG